MGRKKKIINMEIVNSNAAGIDVGSRSHFIAVSDITGQTGLKIICAVCNGITDPNELSKLVHRNCRKSPEEIAKALNNNHRQHHE